ncbi:TerB family tellurite resistance protein [Halodurantibacterium flavum]|uniref:TerB family tellurite resistance protein n=1 Tax=Halodurantibacterium flavum TaxID=1382802 RepID=A0ABW4S302_9RHOB
MSIWTRISAALAALANGEGLAQVFDRLRQPPERSVAFTIAVIALGAKMAKADGTVTRSEVAAFREVFHIAPEDEAHAARVYNLARQCAQGYEAYAQRISGMFRDDNQVLIDLMEGLFHIAVADGGYHPDEEEFLRNVATIFGLSDKCFRAIRSRYVTDALPDPYEVLGVSLDTPMDSIRRAWREAVKESHPDRMIARGLPPEAVKLAERRLQAVNRAWEEISHNRAA